MRFEEFIKKQSWIFAKTYSDRAPHEYIVRDKINGTDEEFVNAVEYIREKGFDALFWGRKHTYLYEDGKFYWTMGDPIDETIILNRCDASNYNITFSYRR